ncbi:MAG: hypothetical protein AAB915_01815 [Patescibacteria group bacterium]|mgnify:CR=1 FL=1
MDFTKIKNMVRGNGDKVILVENDEPEIVMMSFAEYEKIANGRSESGGARRDLGMSEPADVGLASSDDMRETEFASPPAVAVSDIFLRPEEVRLEDLPL